MSDFFASFDRAEVTAHFRGVRARLRTGHGLFSADRVDDGTRLLLQHLPAVLGGRVLDVGGGYGALGLPIALATPALDLTSVDRDLVAVRYTERNARELGLDRVEVHGSLGYDELADREFDLVLCNVPARIGRAGLMHLVEGAVRRLSPSGELRTVVIRDLVPVLESIATERGHAWEPIATGPRHAVHRFVRPASMPIASEDPMLYGRDEIALGGLAFARPHDASEDPGHAANGAPLLAEVLPRSPREALVWRSAHGAMAVLLARSGSRVIAADRDLLALAFARINAERHGVAVETQAAAWLGELPTTRVPLVIAELTPSAGEKVARAELRAAAERVAPRGSALVLGPARLLTAVLARDLAPWRPSVLATREGWQVVRIAG